MQHRAMDWPNAPVQEDVPDPGPGPGGKTGFGGTVPPQPKPAPKEEGA
jgi:hypothetical protein